MPRKILTVLASLLLSSQIAVASWSVGNGGDSLRLAFQNSKNSASRMVLKVKRQAFPATVNPQVVAWILANQEALASDIIASPHRWTKDPQATCAWTTRPQGSERIPSPALIDFSFPTCRTAVEGFGQANELLIHESVHHFGIDDEAFADSVAIAIVNAWKMGKTEWLTIPGAVAGEPSPRKQHSAVWTGSTMIVFGGVLDANYTINSNKGYQFDPVSFSWTELAKLNAPARHGHTAIWTGDSMIIWGGFKITGGRSNWQNSGAIWTARSNSWEILETPIGPKETGEFSNFKLVQTAIWTGDKLITWGGIDSRGEPIGGIYNPATRSWKRISGSGAPIRLYGHSATWVDGKMIIWGGVLADNTRTNTGAVYDLDTDSWEQLPAEGAPLATERHSAVWTGKEFIVFGGFDSSTDLRGQGGVFDPHTQKWQSFFSESAVGRTEHSSVWSGESLLVFGGKSKRLRTYLNNVASFNPLSQEWNSKQGLGAPIEREGHTAVWTGTSMIVWGGADKDGLLLGNGGIYFP